MYKFVSCWLKDYNYVVSVGYGDNSVLNNITFVDIIFKKTIHNLAVRTSYFFSDQYYLKYLHRLKSTKQDRK